MSIYMEEPEFNKPKESYCVLFSRFLKNNSMNITTICILTINIMIYTKFTTSLNKSNETMSDSIYQLGLIKSFIDSNNDVILKFSKMSNDLITLMNSMISNLDLQVLALQNPGNINSIIPSTKFNITLIGNAVPQTSVINVHKNGTIVVYSVCSDDCPSNYQLQVCDIINQCMNLNVFTTNYEINRIELDEVKMGKWYVRMSCVACYSIINLTVE